MFIKYYNKYDGLKCIIKKKRKHNNLCNAETISNMRRTYIRTGLLCTHILKYMNKIILYLIFTYSNIGKLRYLKG